MSRRYCTFSSHLSGWKRTVATEDFPWPESKRLTGALWMQRGKSFPFTDCVFSLREQLHTCVNVFVLTLPIFKRKYDRLALWCVYLVSWRRGKKRGIAHSHLAQLRNSCPHTHKVQWHLFDFVLLSINCFIWGRNVHSLEMNRRPAPAVLRLYFNGIVADCFCSGKKKIPICGSVMTLRAKSESVLFPRCQCFPTLCPGVAWLC